MKIVFAGTPDFAKQHLDIVLDSKHEIVGVLTQPDRRSGRGKKLQSSAVKDLALKKGLPVMQPEGLKNDQIIKTLKDLNPDIILVVAYGLLVLPAYLIFQNLAVSMYMHLYCRGGGVPLQWNMPFSMGIKKLGLAT